VRSTGTVDKDVTYGYGADGKPTTVLYPGTSVPYTYTYDLMDRPIKMTGPLTLFGTTTVDLTKDVVYGVAGQVTSMKYMQWAHNGAADLFTETRTYDTLFQLTRQVTTGTSGTAADIGYTYSGSQNNGRILSRTNYERSGEVVTYQYDSLNRVTSAGSSVGWTQSFDFDGFGTLWSQTMVNGTATPMNVNIDMTTNRINSSGWSHDANGNTDEMPTLGGNATLSYDLDNRLSSWTGPGGVEQYGYLADNKRVWKKAPSGAETVYFYGAGGQKLITYTVQASPFALISPSENVYFGGKLIRANGISVVHDRLGSVVARGCADCGTVTKHDYLPYGEEMGSSTAGNVDKFGTYHRDATTGLDYADQRYFAGLSGRFLTADDSGLNESLTVSASWNQYSYVMGDPINFTDPEGLACRNVGLRGWAGIPDRMPVGTFLNNRNDLSVLSETIFTESEAGVADNDSAQDRAAIASTIMNRWTLVNRGWDVIAVRRGVGGGGGPIRLSDWGQADGTVASIVFAQNQFEPWESVWRLNSAAQARLTRALNSNEDSDECAALLQSIGTAAGFWAARNTPGFYRTIVNGLSIYFTSFSAAARGNQPTKAYYETWIGSFGSANVYSGVLESEIVPRGSVNPWVYRMYPLNRSESGTHVNGPGTSWR